MKRLTFILALALAGTAHAEPFAFKGVALGSDIGLIAGDARYQCRAAPAPGADRICNLRAGAEETLIGAPVHSIFWFYYHGRLTGITIQFDETRFDAAVAALAQRYGAAEVQREDIRNLAGKHFENRRHHWRRDGASLVAERYAGRLDRSSLRYADEAAIARIEARRKRIRATPEQDI